MRRRKLGWLVLLAVAAAGCTSPPYTPPRAPQASAQIPPEVVYQKGHFVGGGGLKLFEQSWRPDKTPRAVVVLVHGLKDHSSRYRDLGIHLAYRGVAVYAFDLRGHGYSEGVRDHIDSLDNAVTDLDALVTLVRDRQPGKPIYLLGQGFGASLAAVYAARKADPKSPVAGLVLSAPPLRGEVKRSERRGHAGGGDLRPAHPSAGDRSGEVVQRSRRWWPPGGPIRWSTTASPPPPPPARCCAPATSCRSAPAS